MRLILLLLRVAAALAGVSEFARLKRGTPGRSSGTPKDTFDRDGGRLEFERARFEAERKRADEAIRLERLRQAAGRQVGELRVMAWIAVATWIASALFALRVGSVVTAGARVLLGIGWAGLLMAVTCVLVAHARIAREFAIRLEDGSPRLTFTSGAAAARWLLVAGLGFTGASLLLMLR